MAMYTYDESSIEHLKGLEGIRQRPNMYVPTIEQPHHLFKETISNSVDEHFIGFGDTLIVQKRGNQIIVRDFGRGIPFGIHPVEGISTLTVVATMIHAGGKFSNKTYTSSGGLFGVGLSVVNALSSQLHIQSFRDGQTGYQQFCRGTPTSEVVLSSTNEPNGTLIAYTPDDQIFQNIESNVEMLIQELYFVACLNKLKIVCDFDNKQLTLQDMSIATLINKFSSHNAVEVPRFTLDNKVYFQFSFALSKTINSRKFLFVNGIPVQKGNFVKIFFNSFVSHLHEFGLKFEGQDLSEVINLVLSIKIPVDLVMFKGQAKEEANINYNSTRQVFDILFGHVFESNAFCNILKLQYKKAFAVLSKRRKLEGDINLAFKELKKIEPDSGLDVLPGKLVDCQIQGDGELFLVEGESASGTCKQARSRKFQAVLPLRGKILNTLKSNYSTTLKNEIIQDIMVAVGISIKNKNVVINPRYRKIILACDADSVSENSNIVFINNQGLIDYKKVKDIDNEIKYVLSLNTQTNGNETKEVIDVISHEYNKGYINKITVYGGHSEEYTDDHMLFIYDKVERVVKQVSPLDIDIDRHLFLATECQLFLNKKFSVEIIEHLFSVATKNNKIRIRINSNDFDWKTLDGKIDIGGRVKYVDINRATVARKLKINISTLRMYDTGRGNTKAPLSIINKLRKLVVLDLKDSIIDLSFTYKNKRYVKLGSVIMSNKESNKIRTSITITKELAYIIGAYLGNGRWGSNKNNPYEILIYCGERLYLYNKLKSCCYKCGLNKIVKDGVGTASIKIKIKSVELCALLSYFGLMRSICCNARFIPKIFFSCEEEVRVWLLMGLYDANGSLSLRNNKYYRLNYNSTSLQLTNDLLLMLKQFSVIGSFISQDKVSTIAGYGVRGKPIINKKIGYQINIGHKEDLLKLKQIFEHRPGFNIDLIMRVKSKPKFVSIGKGIVLLPIKKVEQVLYTSNKVYDLSVKDNHTFPCGIQGLMLKNSDGYHIACLLLIFFLKWARPLIENGYVYVSRLPLFLVRNKKNSRFVYDERFLKKTKGDIVSRFKGLGEMNPKELEETLFEPKTRKLVKINIEDIEESITVAHTLMGGDSNLRLDFMRLYMQEFDHLNLDL